MNEASILAEYLLGKASTEQETLLYNNAMEELHIFLTEEEQKIWDYMMNNHWSIPTIDGALALTEPNGTIRRKIFIMLAILEASPADNERFLPRRFNPLYIFKILFSGIRAVIRAIIGLILLKFIR